MIWQLSQRKQHVSTLAMFKSQQLSLRKNMNHISHIVIISHSTENVLPQNVKETLENAVF